MVIADTAKRAQVTEPMVAQVATGNGGLSPRYPRRRDSAGVGNRVPNGMVSCALEQACPRRRSSLATNERRAAIRATQRHARLLQAPKRRRNVSD